VRSLHLLSLAFAVLVVGLVFMAACGAPVRQAAPPSWDGRRFDDLKWRYMVALDDRPTDETAASLQMENALGKEVDDVLRAYAAGALTTEAERADAGLVLVYDALLLQRNLAHAMSGKIDRQALSGDATSRRRRAVELLERAKTLRPADGRVASWLAASQGMADLGPDGELTGARKEALLAAIDVEPSFNLFTAYITMRDEPLDTAHSKSLFAKTRAFLESRQCRDVKPGSPDARRCEGSPDREVEQGGLARCAHAPPGGAQARRRSAERGLLALRRVRQRLRLRELPRALDQCARFRTSAVAPSSSDALDERDGRGLQRVKARLSLW
jgi:hypothetical protein